MSGGGGGFIDSVVSKGKKGIGAVEDFASSAKDNPLDAAILAGSYLYGGAAGGQVASAIPGNLWDFTQPALNKAANPVSGGVAAVDSTERILADQKDQATGLAEKDAAQAEASLAQAIAALPKDPTVDEIQRQRKARGGRRGTILTTDQSLGSTGQGKSLLGL